MVDDKKRDTGKRQLQTNEGRRAAPWLFSYHVSIGWGKSKIYPAAFVRVCGGGEIFFVCDCMVFCTFVERSRETIYARKGIGPILLQYRAMKFNTCIAANEIVSGDKGHREPGHIQIN